MRELKVSKKEGKAKIGAARPVRIAKGTVRSKSVMAKVYDALGKSMDEVMLSKDIFGQAPNERLMSQALRVYFANSQSLAAHTKTRAEVSGGGVKPWRQKGTGRARAGSIRSPLWVGGGVALGPRPRIVKLSLPKKMKKRALILALSAKQKEGSIAIIKNIEKIEPKTKIIANLLQKLEAKGKTLLVITVGDLGKNVKLAARNIADISVSDPQNLNAYEVFRNNKILISKEALLVLEQSRFSKQP